MLHGQWSPWAVTSLAVRAVPAEMYQVARWPCYSHVDWLETAVPIQSCGLHVCDTVGLCSCVRETGLPFQVALLCWIMQRLKSWFRRLDVESLRNTTERVLENPVSVGKVCHYSEEHGHRAPVAHGRQRLLHARAIRNVSLS